MAEEQTEVYRVQRQITHLVHPIHNLAPAGRGHTHICTAQETKVRASLSWGKGTCVTAMLIPQLCQLPGWELLPRGLQHWWRGSSSAWQWPALVTYWWEPCSSVEVSPSSLVNRVSRTVVAQMLPLEGHEYLGPYLQREKLMWHQVQK